MTFSFKTTLILPCYFVAVIWVLVYDFWSNLDIITNTNDVCDTRPKYRLISTSRMFSWLIKTRLISTRGFTVVRGLFMNSTSKSATVNNS